MRRLEELIRKVEEQKRKWWSKSQSYDTMSTIVERMFELEPYMWRYFNFEMMTSYWFSILFVMNFGIDFDWLDIMNLNFTFEAPSLEDILAGIFVKISKIDINELYRRFALDYYGIELPVDFRLDFFSLLDEFVKFRYRTAFYPRMPSYPEEFPDDVARYEVDYYDEKRYLYMADPEGRTVSTIGARLDAQYYDYCKYFHTMTPRGYSSMSIKRMFTPSYRVETKILRDLGICNETLAKNFMDRTDILLKVAKETTICGLAICGESKCPKRTDFMGLEYYEANIELEDGKKVRILFRTVDQILFGEISGFTVCGYGRVMPHFECIFTEKVFDFFNYRLRDAMARVLTPLTALSLTEGGRAARRPFKSKKTMTYGSKMINRYTIDSIVRAMLSGYGFDPFTLNKYVNFAVDYVFSRIRKHEPIDDWIKDLTDYEYRFLIVSKWVMYGLDKNICEMIMNRLDKLKQLWERGM